MASIRDANLYTLLIRPSPDYPNVLQLIDSSRGSEVRYLRVKEDNSVGPDGKPKLEYAAGGYDAGLYDAYTNAKLASVSASSLKAKSRKLELHSPDIQLPFGFSGTLSFEWTFTFEGHKFRWNRPTFHSSDYVCSLDRKPDPSVQLCLGREPAKGKDGIIQLLDYNLERFEFEDKKGLEIAMYTSLLSILDAAEERLAARDGKPTVQPKVATTEASGANPGLSKGGRRESAGKAVGTDDMSGANPNELFVRADGSTTEYSARAVSLLADPSVLFIIIKTRQAEAAQKAVEVADATKRARHRAGLDQDSRGLYQYVVEEEVKSAPRVASGQQGPRVIDLNDAPKSEPKRSDTKAWRPPPNISIYLSKIELPDLHPGRLAAQKSSSSARRSPPRSSGQTPPLRMEPPPVPKHNSPGPGTSHANLRPPSSNAPNSRQPSSSSRMSPQPRPSPPNPSISGGQSRPSSSVPAPIAKPQVPSHLPPEPEPFGLGTVGSKIAARLFSSK
ncbi:hypothetical protein HD553DRAFT_217070 [Filobasidium floriforme]|uniref:uncharacterized protein n=1 Tax=Filobasidium floriforme TaxID=5210 RepID=UPI001E8E6985|nr:uncharacterized protein HD553DRAFT_217070 [Filobasidium floriforme]KAH8086423.1 hypothetical protein HD553DRAFT_217070 [Filobasidium floriforme]